MYIAQMFCYGKDPLAVGVDGISGCMGVFAYHKQMLYAVHLPDNPNKNKLGGDTFCDYVLQEDANFDGTRARLFFVLNQTQRPKYMVEVLSIGKKLGVAKVEIVRIMKGTGPSSNPNAVAILCERHGPETLVLKYQATAGVTWRPGGTARAGYYHVSSFTASQQTSGALADGWTVVSAENSVLKNSTLNLA